MDKRKMRRDPAFRRMDTLLLLERAVQKMQVRDCLKLGIDPQAVIKYGAPTTWKHISHNLWGMPDMQTSNMALHTRYGTINVWVGDGIKIRAAGSEKTFPYPDHVTSPNTVSYSPFYVEAEFGFSPVRGDIEDVYQALWHCFQTLRRLHDADLFIPATETLPSPLRRC